MKLKWEQVNAYPHANYIISKYFVIVQKGGTLVKKELIKDSYEKCMSISFNF